MAGRALLVFILLLSLIVPVAVGITIFTLLYSLAILGPWLSGKISLKGRFRGAIDWIFGIDEIHRFRDDIKSLVGKHSQLEIGDRSAPEIREDILDIHTEASDQAERGEFVIAVVTGILSLVVGTLTRTSVIGWLLGTYSVIMTLTIGVHVVVLDILTYNREDDLSPYRRKHLVLLEGWNRAILSSRRTQARILVVGLLHRFSPFGYELAKELLDEIMEQDMDTLEAIFFITFTISKSIDDLVKKGID
ncbi:hypothetical protein [Halorubrum sp. DTA46]|uniref:hypothetical protein n=1 Tax=Halorubrum sp. DTA46 TaxID=3402162 RepID=UPI003AAF3668